MIKDTKIEVASIYGVQTKQGMVELVVGREKVQMDLAKAREVRDLLTGAIEAAVTDGLVMAFLMTKIGLPFDAAGRALLDFRELRQGSRSTVYPS